MSDRKLPTWEVLYHTKDPSSKYRHYGNQVLTKAASIQEAILNVETTELEEDRKVYEIKQSNLEIL